MFNLLKTKQNTRISEAQFSQECLHVGFTDGSVAKRQPANERSQEMQLPSLGWEDPLEKEMATHSHILAWESHGQRSLGCMRSQRIKPDLVTKQQGLYTDTCFYFEKTQPVFTVLIMAFKNK